MIIEPFKLISFGQEKWRNSNFSNFFVNSDTQDKVQKTINILEYIKNMISKGEARIEQEAYIYILNIKNKIQDVTSIIGTVHYDEKSIFAPNEDIHKDKFSKYMQAFDKYKIQVNPLLTFYKGNETVKSLAESTMQYVPKIEANINESTYRLWPVKNPVFIDNINNFFSQINKLYIADGHHRFSVFYNILRKTYAKIMVSVTDCTSISFKSCHKVIIGKIAEDWIQKISKYCVLEILEKVETNDSIILYFKNGSIYKILFRPELIYDMPLYFILNNMIIKDAFNIKDTEKQTFSLPGGISFSDSEKIFDLYKDSEVIIFVPNLDISEFFKIVDNGNKLPPTSTWFEPKIVDGFMVMNFG